MSDTNHTSKDGGRFLTVDCDDFWLDGPGDHPVPPIPPERLEQAKALRDRLLSAEATEKQATRDVPKS